MSSPVRSRPVVVFLPPNPWEVTPPADDRIDTTLSRRLLAEAGYEPRVLNPFGRPWNLFGRSIPFLRGLDLLRALRVLFAHRRAAAVVCVFETPGLFLLLLRRPFFFRPKVILWDASTGNPWRFLQFVQRVVFPRYDGLMMLTTTQMKYLRANHSTRGPLFHLGYNVDEQFFHPRHNTGSEYILAVGDDRSRDYPTLAAAVRGGSNPVKLKTKWRPDSLDGLGHVEFLSGRLDDVAFRGLYAGAKLVVVPLTPIASAGGITSLFEAMAMGKPVIVTESAITRDFVTHGETGWVVPPDDPIALKDAITSLLADDDLRDTLGRNARRAIEERFSSRALAERLAKFVGELTGRLV